MLHDLRLPCRTLRVAWRRIGKRTARGPDCPLSPRRVQRAGAAVLRDAELLSLATASLIVIASVVLVTL